MKSKTLIIASYIILMATGLQAQTFIRNIDIVRLNVFDVQLQEHNHFLYKMANKFHAVTRDAVIRRELLFKPGDQFSQEQLSQSLRNIRALGFIGETEAEVISTGDDSVDVRITTEDLWTTIFGLASEGGGGFYKVTIYAEEKNVAGLGIGIETEATFASDDNDGFSARIYDTRFLGTRNGMIFFYKDYNFENGLNLLFYRPFYSVDTKYSYALNIASEKVQSRLFYRGEEYFRYEEKFNYLGVSASRAFGRYTRFEPQIKYIYSDVDYSESAGYQDIGIIPPDETFSGPGLGFKMFTHRYITARYLDEFGTTEDLTEHATLAGSVIWSGPSFNGNYIAALLSLETGFFFQPYDNIYAGFRNNYSSYYIGDLKRERITNISKAIVYIKPKECHLLALRAASQFAWRQRPDYQLTLGGETGLRGYPDRYLSGTKLFLSNLEYRIFTPFKILTAGIGGAMFFDAGYVWQDPENINISDLKTNIGVGLRVGLTKSSTARTVRLDLARALNEDNWYISFGTENIFSLAGFQ